jgi:hypothetical protein
MSGLGWEIQAAIATTVTAANVFDHTTLLAECLDDNEIDMMDRHIPCPPAFVTCLKQAAELQPSGIEAIYSGTVVNGKVMRISGFDIHSAAGSRVSTRAGHSTATNTGPDTDTVPVAGAVGSQIPATHTGCCTFADKWSESRVVDAENQFAKKYQGLFLYGALIPAERRKWAAMLFATTSSR